jgi:hypothetical protein
MEKALPNHIRLNSKRAVDALLDGGLPSVGRMRGDQQTLQAMKKMLSDTADLRALDFGSKNNQIRATDRNLTSGRTREPGFHLRWMDLYTVEFGDVIERNTNLGPMEMFQNNILALYQTYDYARDKRANKLRPGTLFGPLKRDPFFRRDISEDQLLKLISKPEVVNTPGAIMTTLVAIGAKPDLAQEVANKFLTNEMRFLLQASVGGISLQDPILANLDLSLEKHLRIVTLKGDVPADIENYLRIHGMALSVLNGLRYKEFRYVTITCTPRANAHARKVLLKSKFEPASELIYSNLDAPSAY